MSFATFAFLGLLLCPEGPTPTATPAPKPPAGTVVVIDGAPYSQEAYEDFLFQQVGAGALELFINEQLAQAAGRKLGLTITDEDAAAWADEKTREAAEMSDFRGMTEKERSELKRRYMQIAKSGALIERLIKRHRLSDEGLKGEYDLRYGEKRQARHILIRAGEAPPGSGSEEDYAEAKKKIDAIHDELRKVADDAKKLDEAFTAAAKKDSADPGSAERGGELPEFNKVDMVPEFAEAAFNLKEGQLSAPVKTDFGWHVILLTKVIPPAKSFDDEVKKELREEVTKRPVDKEEHQRFIDDLRKDAKIERVLE